MSEKCQNCDSYYNSTSRKPIIINECGCIYCLECINQALNGNIQRKIQCPGCLQQSILPDQLKVSSQVMNRLQELDNIIVKCENHQPEIAENYCLSCDIPVCLVCKLDDHKGHQFVDFKLSKFKTYSENVMTLFDQYSVNNMISLLTKQCKNEIELTSTQFKSMISKVQRMLGHSITEQEFGLIDFVTYLDDPQNNLQIQRVGINQFEQIPRRQSQYVFSDRNIQNMIKNSQAIL
eukprot:403371293